MKGMRGIKDTEKKDANMHSQEAGKPSSEIDSEKEEQFWTSHAKIRIGFWRYISYQKWKETQRNSKSASKLNKKKKAG